MGRRVLPVGMQPAPVRAGDRPAIDGAPPGEGHRDASTHESSVLRGPLSGRDPLGGEPGRGGAEAPANRLAKETSPYLLLHAHNPVDWYPWGPEAFAKAKAEDKPIFLSIGYSSCYWCHVMERECFMDAEIAKLLNEQFVCIKVDREERPDVDQIYMTALQAFGNGGWPMSMFLTPDGRPFFGGTYFPPEDREGMPGFPTILQGVVEAWRDERPAVEKAADRLAEVVRRTIAGAAAARPGARLACGGRRGPCPAGRAVRPRVRRVRLRPENAAPAQVPRARQPRLPPRPAPPRRGRGRRRAARSGTPTRPEPLAMVLTTLDHMARGGIRDQLAGGYHRYCDQPVLDRPALREDALRQRPARLGAPARLRGHRRPALAGRGRGHLRLRRAVDDLARGGLLLGPRRRDRGRGGGLLRLDPRARSSRPSARARPRRVRPGLRAEARAQLREGPLRPARAPARVPTRPGRSRPRPRRSRRRLAPLRAKLLAVRDARPAPLRDDKVLTSWNGLMIAAYADGFRLLKDPAYRQAAEKAADFLLTKLRTPDGRLLRTYRGGQAKLPAYLEDYAFLAHGLLRLHAATGDPKRLAQARELTDRMIADFADTEQGGFFYTADDHESLLARPKDPYDNALPSGNSVAIRNLVALAAATGEPSYLDHAGKALDAFSPAMAQNPAALPLMLVALEEYLDARPAAGADRPTKPGGR